MREMKATMQNKHCGGTVEANHNDRSFNISNADNIDDIGQDQVWIFPDGEKPQRLLLQQHALRDFEQAYYANRFGSAIEAQKEKYQKNRQKSRAEGCTAKKYYDSKKTGPESTILQVGKEWEYSNRGNFVKMVRTWKNDVEEETEDARIKVLSISVHGSEKYGSLHVHLTKSFEVKDANGNWVQDVEKCLERLGYKLPNENRKKDRYNNRKMVWTEEKRQKWYDIIEQIDPEIKIDRTPDPQNPKTKGKVNKAITKMNELKREFRELKQELEALESCLTNLSDKERQERLKSARERMDVIFGKMDEMQAFIESTPKKSAKKKFIPKEEVNQEQDEERER